MLTIDINLLHHLPQKYAIPTEAERVALRQRTSHRRNLLGLVATLLAPASRHLAASRGWLALR